jgi:hypothetical protein
MAAGVGAAMLYSMLSQPPPVRTSRQPNAPWGAASLVLGILTLVGTIATLAVWTAISGSGPLTVSMSAVVVFGVAAVATGARARRIGPSGATGSGRGLAGILTGTLGMVATVGWIVLSVAFVLLAYLFVALAFALSGEDLTGAVL